MNKIVTILVALSLLSVSVEGVLAGTVSHAAPVRVPSKTGGPDGSVKPIPPQRLPARSDARHLRAR